MSKRKKGLWGSGILEADNATMMYEVAIKKLAAQVDEAVVDLGELKGPDQWVLATALALLHVCKGYPNGARQALKHSHVIKWKTAFADWIDSPRAGFPKEYKSGIEQEANRVFDELLELAPRG
jgi:hypothetical protein